MGEGCFVFSRWGEVWGWSVAVAAVTLGHSIKWGWHGLKCREAFTPSQESCDLFKLFATASSSQYTGGDLVGSNKRIWFFFSRILHL